MSYPSVFYLANAGIYLTDRKTGILVDGLFERYDGFDTLPVSIETAIMEKQPPFEQLTTLLFTHTHVDHYSAGRVSAYLERYPETECILPAPADSGCHTVSIHSGSEHYVYSTHTGFSKAVVEQLHSKHLMDKGKIVPHTALFLNYAGQCFFFSGDSDPVYLNRYIPQEILSACCGKTTMAFVNPFFFPLAPGRRFLENLNPKQIFVYHMPLQVPDPLRYHEILDRGLAKYSGKAPVRTMNRFMCRLQ